MALGTLLCLAGRSADGQAGEGRSGKFTQALALGEARWKEGNFEGAFAWLREALAIAQETSAFEDEAGCLNRLGRLCWALGKPDDSPRFYSQALTAATQITSPTLARESRVGLKILELYSQGKADRSAGRLGMSIQVLEEAVRWSRRLGSPEHEVKCLRQLSLSYLGKGRRETFLALNQQALEIARRMNDRGEQAKCQINFGGYDFGSKNYNRALNDYSEAADLSRKIGNRADELVSLKNIGTILMGLGFYERSLDYFQAACDLDRQSENGLLSLDLNQLGQAFRSRGLILSSRNDIAKSVDFFGESLALAIKEGDTRTQFVSLNNLGQAYLDLGKDHTALHCLEEASGLAKKLEDHEAAIDILTNLGICRLRLGSPELAREYLEEAVDLSGRRAPNMNFWETLFYLGRCHEQQGHVEQALAYYRNSVDAIDYVRSRIRLDEFKTGFARNKAKVYESLISLLFRQNADGRSPAETKEIFLVVERAKARAFFETLAANQSSPADETESDLKAAERELCQQIAALISRSSRRGLTGEKKSEIEKNLRQKEEEYLRLLSRMQAELEGPEGLASPLPAGLEQIQDRLLDEKTAVLEYSLGQGQSYLLLITKAELRVIPLPAIGAIESSLRAYARLLSDPPRGEWRGIPAGRHLFRILLSEAMASLPPRVGHLIIIPDGPLTGLPFETLPLPAAAPMANEDYLISRYSVSYGVSCSSLLFLKERVRMGNFSKELLAMGNPSYPSRKSAGKRPKLSEAGFMRDLYESQGFELAPLRRSQDEVKKIAGFFPKHKADVYLGKDATEGRLKKAGLENYEVVHFACHAYQDEKVPFRSGLFLSLDEGQVDDGFLHAREAAALRFRAELVVLSACRTSSGYVEEGEGSMGLTRVFFYAGARSIVSSLWEVSDRAVAEFMPRFYRHLTRGESKAQALRSAKLEMLDSRYSHPFYWAAFVFTGEPFGRIDAD
jgi:CHAT domain-containing protein/tetratricopeptide (TPR) repeat protein